MQHRAYGTGLTGNLVKVLVRDLLCRRVVADGGRNIATADRDRGPVIPALDRRVGKPDNLTAQDDEETAVLD